MNPTISIPVSGPAGSGPNISVDLLALMRGGQVTLDDGRLITMDLGPDDVHIQQALADAVFGFSLTSGVADIALPVVNVPKAGDYYWVWDKNDTFQQANSVQSAPGATVQELPQRLSKTQFQTLPYALAAFVPSEVEANADSRVSPRRAAVRRLMNALHIAREVRVATLLRNATNYGAAFKSSIGASAKWNGGASSNPVQDIYTRIEAAAAPITNMIWSEQLWHDFVQNSAVQKYTAFKQFAPGIPNASGPSASATASQFAALLGLPPITVAAMKAVGATSGTLDYVWGGDAVLLHQPPSAGVSLDGQDIATGYTFRWTGADGLPPDAGTMASGFFIRQYFDPKRGARGGTVIIVGHNDAEQFITDYVSGLLVGAHQ